MDGSPSGRQLSGSKRKSPTKRRAASSNKKVKLDDDEEEEEAAPLEATPLPQQEEKEVISTAPVFDPFSHNEATLQLQCTTTIMTRLYHIRI